MILRMPPTPCSQVETLTPPQNSQVYVESSAGELRSDGFMFLIITHLRFLWQPPLS